MSYGRASIFCPFPERQLEAWRLATLCQIRQGPEAGIARLAESFQHQAGISAKDSLHLACAAHAAADFFLTCDDRLIKQAGRLALNLGIKNPVDYIRMENFDG